MAPTAAAADELVKTYGTGDAVVKALDGVSVTVEAGALTAVMGPSGSGKSTLMHCMAGLDRPTSGRAFIGQTDVATLTDRKLTLLRRERVGFIFQQFNLVPTLPDASPTRSGGTPSSTSSDWPTGSTTSPPSCQVGSSSASPVRAPSWADPRSSSPTSPPAIWTP